MVEQGGQGERKLSDTMYLMFWTSLLPLERDVSIADEMKEWAHRFNVPQTEFYADRPHLHKWMTDLLGL